MVSGYHPVLHHYVQQAGMSSMITSQQFLLATFMRGVTPTLGTSVPIWAV